MSEMNRKFVAVIGINIWAVVYIIAALYGEPIPDNAFYVGVAALATLGGADALYDMLNVVKGNMTIIQQVSGLIGDALEDAQEKKAA